jgi:DNA-binding NtrC family response regulator/pSer/pThr/pTyr-binding forkhead associated (FHA) protein
MITRTTITEDELESRATGGEGLHVLVISPEIFGATPLPENGTLLVGRSAKAEVLLEDPLASRQHARLTVGEALTIEDLGSANGTRVRDMMIEPHKPVTLAPGEAVGIGSTTLIVQRSRWSPGPRRLWAHGMFENRLKDECVRAEATGGRFALLRLRLEPGLAWTRVFPVLARNILPPHLFASYGPSDYEALLLEPGPEGVERTVEALWAELRLAQLSARIGIAWYPRDGRSADALLARANAQLRPSPVRSGSEPRIKIASPVMQRVYDVAGRAAAANINILILGETGVGKEVMAQHLHRTSSRADKPMVSLNCAGLTENLIESELFGYERGAFTGANQSRPGLLETAQGGTVFLDEIGEMPLRVQATLLRVLETREVLPVGGRRTKPIDVRFIAATNRNLEAEGAKGTFRQDLYFRLNGISVTIPPLRERREEIWELARAFVAQACQDGGRATLPIHDDALALLEEYSWPGNIRELKNAMERAVVLCDGPEILLEHLPLEKMRVQREPLSDVETTAGSKDGDGSLTKSEVRALEKQRIVEALAACAGNQSRAARMLGMPRRTFISKLDLYGIPRPQKKGEE